MGRYFIVPIVVIRYYTNIIISNDNLNKMNNRNHFWGDFIRKKREKPGFSQRELARKVDISYSTMYKIESNKVVPSFPTIVRLSKILGFSIDEIADKLEI